MASGSAPGDAAGGGDNFGVESFPSTDPENYVPVHTYLFAERGVSIIEVLWLEDLAKDQVYDFMFIAAPLKLRALRVAAPAVGDSHTAIEESRQMLGISE